MPELFIELFSEEIPARMQARAAFDLARLLGEALLPLSPAPWRTWHGMRRIAASAEVAAEVPASIVRERGPRLAAPDAAVAGFLRKHGAARDDLAAEGDYWVLSRRVDARPASALVAEAVPGIIRRFPWPKSMRWGTSRLLWVRPLRRIVCLLDGAVVPFDLRDGDDDGHGLRSGNLTEGHRFMAPGAFAVEGAEDWARRLRERFVIMDWRERERIVQDGLSALADAKSLRLVEDEALRVEVEGLAEWPVSFFGRIDVAFMDLPPEVIRVSMRVNQRSFALTDTAGMPAPWFGFVCNIEPKDGGAATVAGNERVLRARLSDARHFWDQDRRVRLEDRLPALDGVVFHAKLGTQGERARRLERLARWIADYVGADKFHAARAGLLAKADLVSGMVGEFPELQGIMGGYYAMHDDEAHQVCLAIRHQYAPLPNPEPVPDAVVIADRLDQLAQFFNVHEEPTGSADPYALRRAAIGLVDVILSRSYRLPLREALDTAGARDPHRVFQFILERLRTKMLDGQAHAPSPGSHDVIASVVRNHSADDLVWLRDLIGAVSASLGTAAGASLLALYRRAANIVRIEERKDGPFDAVTDARLAEPTERALAETLRRIEPDVAEALRAERFDDAMRQMVELHVPLDTFFAQVTVNSPDVVLRRNRLALLTAIRDLMHRVADFSLIEG